MFFKDLKEFSQTLNQIPGQFFKFNDFSQIQRAVGTLYSGVSLHRNEASSSDKSSKNHNIQQ